MNTVLVIPARYASSRLPGKPLRELAGKPLIQHVHERAMAAGFATVLVATDDERIQRVCSDFGAQVAMTASAHETGSDRLAEVVQQQGWADDTIVVNLQGMSRSRLWQICINWRVIWRNTRKRAWQPWRRRFSAKRNSLTLML